MSHRGYELKMTEREAGTVKWYSESRKYGFIVRESGENVFFHFLEIIGPGFRTLHTGDRVEFSLEQGPKGLQATQVKVLL
jgi:CspA family cold shock protein